MVRERDEEECEDSSILIIGVKLFFVKWIHDIKWLTVVIELAEILDHCLDEEAQGCSSQPGC
jgi:hypothetical protein